MKPRTEKPKLNRYKIEWTDTLGGEANYCWVNRSIIEAKNIRQAITKAKKDRYYSPLPRHTLSDYGSDSARIDIINAAVCCFIDWTDEEPTEEPNP
jgi:hypothetical protein